MENLYILLPVVIGIGGVLWYLVNSPSSRKSEPIRPVQPTTQVTTSKPITPGNKKKKLDSKKEEKIDGQPCKIFFGSQTGTAEDFSHKLAAEGKGYGFATQVVDCEDFDFEDLKNEPFAIFVMATYGEGEPTDNARAFDEWMNSSERNEGELSGLKYTVFGLGNKTYEQFNAMARKVDTTMEKCGAQKIYQRGEGDDDGSLEDDFAAWKKELWPSLCEHFGMPIPEVGDSSGERRFTVVTHDLNSQEAKISTDQAHIHLAKRNAKDGNTIDIKNPLLAKLIINRELHTEHSDRSCRHIEFEIGDKLKYEVGDHLGVYVENEPEIVEEVAARLGVDLSTPFSMYPVGKTVGKPTLGPCTIRQALGQYCDLTGQPRKNVLKVFSKYAKDDSEKKRLLALADESNNAEYQSYIKDDQRTILCVLKDFPSIQIPFEHFLELVPRLAPRMYSISSSLKEHPGRVHVTAVVVQFTSRIGRKHNGVATAWLRRQIPGNTEKPILVPVFIEKANFRLPKEPSVPIIMVGPGTGLAPFRGFIQERKHLLKQSGIQSEAILFFGCRSKKYDFIYEEELRVAKDDGHISELVVAFSREGPQKVYVQHKMMDLEENVYKIIHEQQGYFYVCGDAKSMAKEVRQSLRDIIVKYTKKSEEEVEYYLNEMQKNGRYLQDVWF